MQSTCCDKLNSYSLCEGICQNENCCTRKVYTIIALKWSCNLLYSFANQITVLCSASYHIHRNTEKHSSSKECPPPPVGKRRVCFIDYGLVLVVHGNLPLKLYC